MRSSDPGGLLWGKVTGGLIAARGQRLVRASFRAVSAAAPKRLIKDQTQSPEMKQTSANSSCIIIYIRKRKLARARLQNVVLGRLNVALDLEQNGRLPPVELGELVVLKELGRELLLVAVLDGSDNVVEQLALAGGGETRVPVHVLAECPLGGHQVLGSNVAQAGLEEVVLQTPLGQLVVQTLLGDLLVLFNRLGVVATERGQVGQLDKGLVGKSITKC